MVALSETLRGIMSKAIIKIFFVVLLTTQLVFAQIKIIRYETEAVAEMKDAKGNGYIIGLGADALNKTDAELKTLAQQKYDEIKLKEALPVVKDKQQLIRETILNELGTPEDQLEMIYVDMINNTTTWRDKRTEIKNRFK